MQFNTPTTKEQMYVILNDLFYFYRIKREGFEPVEQQGLKLEKIEYEIPSEEQLEEKARILLAAADEREVLALKSKIEIEKVKVQEKISQIDERHASNVEQSRTLYQESLQKLREQAIKNGLINTSAYLDKLTSLEGQMNAKIIELNQKKEEELAQLNADLSALNAQLDTCESYYSSVHEKQVDAKAVELKEDAEKIYRDVFKYNNGVEERVQRYANTIMRSNMSLYLNYLEISSGEFTKDQLVQMGYYDDVIKCACGYYDTLDVLEAYQDICSDKKLPVYLDDYYANFCYMYGLRAGVFS